MQNRGEASPSSPLKSDTKLTANSSTNRKNRVARQERINKLFGQQSQENTEEASRSKAKDGKYVSLALEELSGGRNLRSSKPSIGKQPTDYYLKTNNSSARFSLHDFQNNKMTSSHSKLPNGSSEKIYGTSGHLSAYF